MAFRSGSSVTEIESFSEAQGLDGHSLFLVFAAHYSRCSKLLKGLGFLGCFLEPILSMPHKTLCPHREVQVVRVTNRERFGQTPTNVSTSTVESAFTGSPGKMNPK